jgi:hypothetical protein
VREGVAFGLWRCSSSTRPNILAVCWYFHQGSSMHPLFLLTSAPVLTSLCSHCDCWGC